MAFRYVNILTNADQVNLEKEKEEEAKMLRQGVQSFVHFYVLFITDNYVNSQTCLLSLRCKDVRCLLKDMPVELFRCASLVRQEEEGGSYEGLNEYLHPVFHSIMLIIHI